MQNSHLDSRLFRRGYPADRPRFGPCDHHVKEGAKIAFHPVLDLTWLSRPDLDEADIRVYRPGESTRRHKPLDLPVAAEYATSHPCQQVTFAAETGPVIADRGGVRVRSVIEAVTSMWASSAPTEYTLREMVERELTRVIPREGEGEGEEERDEEDEATERIAEEVARLTMWDALGYQTFWAGMKSAVCVEDVVVRSRAQRH
ncbi:hypothetical protein DMC30DRAFT_349014 [Rhodotorula diobovata]|uniref:Uncharacterized protein n=1 Tax=Rhodotorula diobovata TaxID=5288 RepID=A0A5C5FZW0_9BASI|nr:hypothetical protein DMC30DRAFT_349014 [Rhodotorula diobovata]